MIGWYGNGNGGCVTRPQAFRFSFSQIDLRPSEFIIDFIISLFHYFIKKWFNSSVKIANWNVILRRPLPEFDDQENFINEITYAVRIGHHK